jgi:hypothetical protein
MSSSLKAMIHNRCYDRRVRPSRQFKASKGGQVIGDTQARWSSDEPNSYARVFGYDEEGRLVKIERDYGSGGVQLAYEYGYNSDGARVWKRDVLNEQEYRYVCRIGCGGVPMRVYNRPKSGGRWASVEDYLPAGNALGYNQNWRYWYSGGELLMMAASRYYPMNRNGLAVQNAPAQPCICAVVSLSRTAGCLFPKCGILCIRRASLSWGRRG